MYSLNENSRQERLRDSSRSQQYHHHHHHHRQQTCCNPQNHQSHKYHKRAVQLVCSSLSFIASVSILSLYVTPQLAVAQSLAAMTQKLKIPDIIPITGSTSTIRVEINNNAVKPGDAIPARNFKNLDIMKGVSWDVGSNYDARYTLMLLDLDRKLSNANNNGTHTIYNQYTSLNIPGNYIGAGQVIVAFDPPNVPCHPSTKHRLVMLAFHQDQNIDLADIAYISASAGHSPRRENIKLDDFISRHRLHLVAANVFQAVGEANGICSGSATVYPHIFTLSSSIIIVMVMFHVLMKQQL